MKLITNINWVMIGLYGLLVGYTLLNVNRSGNDAAGRGMETGFLFLGVFVLAALAGLNMLPYRFAKMTALLFLGLPALIGLYNGLSNYLEERKQERIEQSQGDPPSVESEDNPSTNP